MVRIIIGLISLWVLIFGVQVSAANQCHRIYQSVVESAADSFVDQRLSAADLKTANDLTEYFLNLNPKMPAKPFYYDEESLDQNFWSHHKRFAFLLSDEKVVLLTKNIFSADLLMKELSEQGGFKQRPLSLSESQSQAQGQNKSQTQSESQALQIKKQLNQLRYFSQIDAEQVDVTNLLGPEVLSFLRTKIHRRGPNCWNSCLVYSKILDHVRYTPDYEINFWLHSPFVKPIKSFSQLRTGDVLVFKQDKKHEHTFIYISKNIVLTKNGLSPVAKYRLMDIREVADLYFDSHKGEVEAFRVEDIENNKQKMHELMPTEYFELLAHVEYFEKQLSESFRKSSVPLDKNWRKNVVEFVNSNAGKIKIIVDQLGGAQAYFEFNNGQGSAQKVPAEQTYLRLSAWMGLYQRLYALSLPTNN